MGSGFQLTAGRRTCKMIQGNAMKRLIPLLLACCSAASAPADTGPDFTASVDRNVISLDDRLILSVRVSGAGQRGEPELPPLDGFQLINTGRQTSIQIVNFRTMMSAQYDYTLVPVKAGKLTIGPVTLRENGRVHRTEPIVVEVLDRGRPASPAAQAAAPQIAASRSAGQVFVEISADRKECWLREQVIVTSRFYCLADTPLAEKAAYSAPPADGFVERQLGDGNSVNYSRIVNGRRYQVSELKTALYPYRTGALTIGPAKVKGSILAESPRRARAPRGIFDLDDIFGDPFFGRYVRKPFSVASNTLTIDVRPLPKEGAPSGDVPVGVYRLSVEAKPREVRVGDPVTLNMTVTGDGDLDRVPPPRLSSIERFKAYEPTSSSSGGTGSGSGGKTFEQAVVPLDERVKEIPPVVFNYFDPREGKYVSLRKGPFPLKVLPPQAGGVGRIVSLPAGVAEGRDVKLLERNIVFIKGRPGALRRDSGGGAAGTLFWLVQLVPLCAVAAAFVHARHRARLSSDQGYARLYRAGGATRARLKSAEKAMRAGRAEEFHGVIARAVSSYVADRLNIPAGGFTPEQVRERLAARGADGALLARLERFYKACDLARFAPGGAGGEEMAQLHREATEILEELRRGKW